MKFPTYLGRSNPYGNAPASWLVATGMGAWPVQLPRTVGPYLPQGSTMAYGGYGGPGRPGRRRTRTGYGNPLMIAAISEGVGQIFGFGSQIAANVGAKKGRESEAAAAAQAQKLMYLQLQQGASATASGERNTILLVGGGLAAVAVLGAIALTLKGRPKTNGRRRNGRRRTRRNR